MTRRIKYSNFIGAAIYQCVFTFSISVIYYTVYDVNVLYFISKCHCTAACTHQRWNTKATSWWGGEGWQFFFLKLQIAIRPTRGRTNRPLVIYIIYKSLHEYKTHNMITAELKIKLPTLKKIVWSAIYNMVERLFSITHLGTR